MKKLLKIPALMALFSFIVLNAMTAKAVPEKAAKKAVPAKNMVMPVMAGAMEMQHAMITPAVPADNLVIPPAFTIQPIPPAHEVSQAVKGKVDKNNAENYGDGLILSGNFKFISSTNEVSQAIMKGACGKLPDNDDAKQGSSMAKNNKNTSGLIGGDNDTGQQGANKAVVSRSNSSNSFDDVNTGACDLGAK